MSCAKFVPKVWNKSHCHCRTVQNTVGENSNFQRLYAKKSRKR